MKSARIVLVPVLAMIAGACSSMTINHDWDPSAVDRFPDYQSWGWLPRRGDIQTDPGRRVNAEFVKARVEISIENRLAQQGFETATAGDPDFWIGYHIGLNTQVEVTHVNTYWGYGWGGWYGGGVRMSTPVVNQYEQGTLIIDIVDVEEKALVWRGTAEAEVYPDMTPQERQDRLDDAVKRILEQFPPSGY